MEKVSKSGSIGGGGSVDSSAVIFLIVALVTSLCDFVFRDLADFTDPAFDGEDEDKAYCLGFTVLSASLNLPVLLGLFSFPSIIFNSIGVASYFKSPR